MNRKSLLLALPLLTAAVPTPLDPVSVAPHIYELAFENDRVRVLKKTIRNGETLRLAGRRRQRCLAHGIL
jgi:hypothetical protein